MGGKRGGHLSSTGHPLQPTTRLGSSGFDRAQLVQLDEAGIRNPDQHLAQRRAGANRATRSIRTGWARSRHGIEDLQRRTLHGR